MNNNLTVDNIFDLDDDDDDEYSFLQNSTTESSFLQNFNETTTPKWWPIRRKIQTDSQQGQVEPPAIDLIITLVGYWELIIVFFVGSPANLLVLYLTVRLLDGNRHRFSSIINSRNSNNSTKSFSFFHKTASTNSQIQQQPRQTTTVYRRHQSNLWFVFSMALSDTLYCLIHAPMMFAQYAMKYKFGTEACLTLYIVTYMSTICSSLSLFWLNVDKFLYLNQPLHYHTRVTAKRAVGAVLCSWATSLVWALFLMLGPFTEYTKPCDFRPLRVAYYMAFAVAFFVVPTVVSLLISAYIAFVVSRVRKENALRLESTRSKSRTSAVRTASTADAQRLQKNVSSIKALLFIFTTTLWSVFTTLPYRFAYLIYISPHFEYVRPWIWLKGFFYILVALLATNAVGNPFITIVTQRRFTDAVSALIGCRTRSTDDDTNMSLSGHGESSIVTSTTIGAKASVSRVQLEGSNRPNTRTSCSGRSINIESDRF